MARNRSEGARKFCAHFGMQCGGHGGTRTSDHEDKVWPTGLTLKEAEEVHSYLIDGTRVFGLIALLAHILVAFTTPWLG